MGISDEILQQLSNSLIWVTDENGICRYSNDAYAGLFNLKRDEVLGKSLHELFPKELADEYVKNNLNVIRNNMHFRTFEMGPLPEGGVGHYLVNKFPMVIEGRKCCGGMAVEINRLYQEHEILNQSLLDYYDAFIFLKPEFSEKNQLIDFSIERVSERGLMFLKISRGELLRKAILKLADLGFRGLLYENYENVFTNQKSLTVDFESQDQKGKTRYYRQNIVYVTNGVAVFVNDITDERQRMMELGRLSKVAERTTNAVILTDPEGHIQWANQGFSKITGYSFDEVIGKKPGDFLQGPETNLQTVEKMRQGIRSKQGFDVTVLNYGKSGRKYWLQIEARPYHNAAGEVIGFMAIEQDVTEQIEMTNKLIHSERLASLGALAAGVAHEINNPLAILMGELYQLKNVTQSDLSRSQMAVERISTIVKGLRDYARVEKYQPKAFSPIEVMNKTIEFLSPILKKNDVHVRFVSEVHAYIEGEPSRFQQIITNLIMNATDAMSANSTKDKTIDIHVKAEGRSGQPNNLIIRVQDHGPGIEPAILPRIFDPFFSTKVRSTGLGLGLSITQSLVAEMKGDITVTNGQHGGAIFQIRLPLLSDPDAKKMIQTQSREQLIQNESLSLRILFVDDEVDLRDIWCEQLSNKGHLIQQAGSGAEALKLIAEQDFDLLITDHLMPKMTGLELIQKAHLQKPNLKSILLSGGLIDHITISTTGALFLAKPFTQEEIDAVIFEASRSLTFKT